ncbi:MAG: efflux RND transporter permease subunit, partial [bacterium]
AAAVSFSLLEARTLTPMRTSRFLEARSVHGGLTGLVDRWMRAARDGYGRLLVRLLAWRWTVVGSALILFALSLLLVGRIPKEFVPSQDQSRFMLRLKTPVGSSMEFTDAKFKEAEAWLLKHPALQKYFCAVGGFGGGEVNTGMMFVTLKAPRERPKGPKGKRWTQAEVMSDARKALNGLGNVRAVAVDLSQGGFGGSRGFPVEMSLRGPDWETLVALSRSLQGRMEASGLMTDVDSDYQSGMPEVRVLPHREQAYARDVSVDSIGTVINAMVGGVRAGYITRGGRRYDVRVRAELPDRVGPENIGRYSVRNSQGEMIRLSDVVRVEERTTLLSITRKNRERAIGLTANVASGKSQAQALAAVEALAKALLPPGYRLVRSGSAATFKDSSESLVFAMIMGIGVAYMVLGSQFNSFIHPLTVLLALPFSVTGALLALWLGGFSLNIYSMIGLILLMGIVKKNSILLVDFVTQRRNEGLPLARAILEACPTRLRPIIMTSASTIAAALPPALALGPGAETRIPMAVAVIGGMLVSTILTLFVVPCAYSLLAPLERRRD